MLGVLSFSRKAGITFPSRSIDVAPRNMGALNDEKKSASSWNKLAIRYCLQVCSHARESKDTCLGDGLEVGDDTSSRLRFL